MPGQRGSASLCLFMFYWGAPQFFPGSTPQYDYSDIQTRGGFLLWDWLQYHHTTATAGAILNSRCSLFGIGGNHLLRKTKAKSQPGRRGLWSLPTRQIAGKARPLVLWRLQQERQDLQVLHLLLLRSFAADRQRRLCGRS